LGLALATKEPELLRSVITEKIKESPFNTILESNIYMFVQSAIPRDRFEERV